MKRMSVVCVVLFAFSSAQAAPVPFTLNNTGTTAWWLSSGTVGPLGSGNPNPTLTLSIGSQYQVTVANWPAHIFELLAKGPNDLQDTVLLSGDDNTAVFFGDANVGLAGFGTGVLTFTLTPTMAAAMTDAGLSQSPGYRCGIHTNTMRGNITLVPEPATMILTAIGGLALLRRRARP